MYYSEGGGSQAVAMGGWGSLQWGRHWKDLQGHICLIDKISPNMTYVTSYMLENNDTTDDAVVPDAGPVLAAGHLL